MEKNEVKMKAIVGETKISDIKIGKSDGEMETNDKKIKTNGREMQKTNFDNPSAFPAFDASLHRKFVDKLLARVDENGTLESTYGKPPSGTEKYTPLEEQVVELKAKYNDILLMIEVGYKYRFFGEDAETAARVLGIFAHYDHNFLTASIPSFRLHVHVRRLVEAGYKVGVVRQTETAALKAQGANKMGPFTRSLSALYTRATLEAAEALGGGELDEKCRLNSYLLCVVEQPLMGKSPKKVKIKSSQEEDSTASSGSYDTVIGVIAVETSTGDVMYGQLKDTVTRAELESCLLNISPAELLLGAPLLPPTEKVLRNNADGSENGSLLWLMDHTHTAFGARLLKHWVTHPLCDRNLISARLDAVSEIVESMRSSGGVQNEGTFPGSGKGGGSVGAASRGRIEGGGSQGLLASFLTSLGKMPDVERGITRIFHRTATAAEFVAVIHALITASKQLQQLHYLEDEISSDDPSQGHHKLLRSQLLKRLISTASSSVVSEHATRLLSALNKDAAAQGDKQNLFICSGSQFPEVAKCRAAIEELDSFLPDYQKQLKLPSLQYLSVSGSTHLIEVPSSLRVPSNWIKVNSTKRMNRYHPPEVLIALEKLAVAKEELTVACGKAWDAFLAEFAVHFTDFRASVEALAALDCLHSLAVLSRNRNYVQPIFVEESESPQLSIRAGRHPVLESTLRENFVPNDTFLHGSGEHCQIITGPNMGGKSCYMRQLPDSCLKQAAIVAAKLEREVSARVLARSGAKSSAHSATSEEQSQIARLLNGENDNESSVALGGSLLSSNEETIALETECIPDIYEISKLLRCVESALKEISPVDVSCALKRAHKHALQILKSGIL